MNNDCKCISEILNVINILQNNAECGENCLETCDRSYLGETINQTGYNTRPVMLYTSYGNGTPWKMPVSKNAMECTDDCSPVFRVEKVDCCCATFRVLNPVTDASGTTYTATNSFFTMNLKDVCCIRCLNDTFVENV